VFRLT